MSEVPYPFGFAICDRLAVPDVVAKIDATHLVSLLDPGVHVYRPASIPIEKHLWLQFYDVNGRGGPMGGQIKRLLDFAKEFKLGDRVLFHCEMGISRSTAAALACLVQAMGENYVDDAMREVLRVRPQALPNPRLLALADRILRADGKLIDAGAVATGKQYANNPNDVHILKP